MKKINAILLVSIGTLYGLHAQSQESQQMEVVPKEVIEAELLGGYSERAVPVERVPDSEATLTTTANAPERAPVRATAPSPEPPAFTVEHVISEPILSPEPPYTNVLVIEEVQDERPLAQPEQGAQIGTQEHNNIIEETIPLIPAAPVTAEEAPVPPLPRAVETGEQNIAEESAAESQNQAVAEESEAQETPLPEEKSPSRSVSLKNNQYLYVDYPGTGWMYLGEGGKTNLMRYFGRKIDTNNTTFSLRSKEEGTTTLHFYKTDPLTGNAIDDYLEVSISGINDDASVHITAPDYKTIVPAGQRFVQDERITYMPAPSASAPKEKPQDTQQSAVSSIQNTSKTTTSNSPTASKEEKATETNADTAKAAENTLLENAKNALEEKNYAACLAFLTDFFNTATARLDEALFLQGNAFEAPSEVRNIKAALDAYETVVKQYPQSALWQSANERAIYLQRFYFTIR